MADDITHTSTNPAGPPDSTKQVTDEHATRGHMPVVKLAISTDGDATLIPAEASNGLDVDVTRVQGNVTVVQGTAASLNVTEASAAAIKTAVETIDNAISGSEMQVDVVAALPAGANKIGGVDLDSDATPAAAVPAVAQFVAGTDGTNARGLKTDTSGELQVDVLSSALPSGAATESSLAAAAASLSVLDDWDETDRAKVNVIAGQAGITAGAGAVGASTPRVTLASDDPAVAALQTLDNAISGSEMQVDVVAALPAGTNNIGDVDVLSIAAGDNNIGNVDVVTLPGVAGDVAHDTGDSGNPVKVGVKGVTADPTAVTANDRANALGDTIGRQVVAPYALHENLLRGATSDITGTGDTEVIAAQSAGIRIYVTHIIVGNSHATVSTWVNIKDGTTTIYTIYAAAAGGGASVTLPVPLRGTAATALNAACVTTGANVRVSASGYKCAV